MTQALRVLTWCGIGLALIIAAPFLVVFALFDDPNRIEEFDDTMRFKLTHHSN